MTLLKSMLYPAILSTILSATAVAQAPQTAPPSQPFKTVHLMNLTSEQEPQFMAAVKDLNGTIAKLGCSTCIYHVYKVNGTVNGNYSYLMTSDWPGGDSYTKIHATSEFVAAAKRNPIIATVRKTELYNRFVEVK